MDNENIIVGRNAVIEALRVGISIDKVFLKKGETDATLRHIASTARGAGIPVVEADRHKIDSLCDGKQVHQGVVAVASYAKYTTIEEITESANQKNQKLLIVICDEISDPHNLGAIIRTVDALGAHGIIIPKRRSAGISASVVKASSGAAFHTPIARVSNITAAIRELKKSGVWVFGASASGDTALWEADFMDNTAIVIGSEGAGISRLVSDNCDYSVCIPMEGKISSLNASVSASILLYEAVRQRR